MCVALIMSRLSPPSTICTVMSLRIDVKSQRGRVAFKLIACYFIYSLG